MTKKDTLRINKILRRYPFVRGVDSFMLQFTHVVHVPYRLATSYASFKTKFIEELNKTTEDIENIKTDVGGL